jgi:hypothetical protein
MSNAEGQWIHVFLHRKDNITNPEAKLSRLREASEYDWYYELHEDGSILQMKHRIRFDVDGSLVDSVDLLRRLGASGDWTLSHHIVKPDTTYITDKDKRKTYAC